MICLWRDLKDSKDLPLAGFEGLEGFEGGKLSMLADYNIHVPINNYGIVEDVHQSLMHIMAQHIRALALKKLNIDIDRITY